MSPVQHGICGAVQNADPDVRKDMETFLSRVAVPEVRCHAVYVVAMSMNRLQHCRMLAVHRAIPLCPSQTCRKRRCA